MIPKSRKWVQSITCQGSECTPPLEKMALSRVSFFATQNCCKRGGSKSLPPHCSVQLNHTAVVSALSLTPLKH